MPVSFSHIPQGWKVPLVYIEVDPSQAGTPTFTKYALLTDYKIAAGKGVVDTPIACASMQDAINICGQGSPLARMFTAFFLLNKASPCVLLPIAEPAAGVAATGDIVVTAGPTQPGTLDLYIGGQNVNVGVSAGDTTAQVAGKIQTAINAVLDLPVTAGAPIGSTTTLTAKWRGITGNDIRVELNVLGPLGGEMTPVGLTLTLPGNNVLANGTGVPVWTNAIANLGDEPNE